MPLLPSDNNLNCVSLSDFWRFFFIVMITTFTLCIRQTNMHNSSTFFLFCLFVFYKEILVLFEFFSFACENFNNRYSLLFLSKQSQHHHIEKSAKLKLIMQLEIVNLMDVFRSLSTGFSTPSTSHPCAL